MQNAGGLNKEEIERMENFIRKEQFPYTAFSGLTYDSGDHLHPGDAGYKAMAAAIDLDALQIGRAHV